MCFFKKNEQADPLAVEKLLALKESNAAISQLAMAMNHLAGAINQHTAMASNVSETTTDLRICAKQPERRTAAIICGGRIT